MHGPDELLLLLNSSFFFQLHCAWSSLHENVVGAQWEGMDGIQVWISIDGYLIKALQAMSLDMTTMDDGDGSNDTGMSASRQAG